MRTDANQCYDLFWKTWNDVAQEEGENHLVVDTSDIGQKYKDIWLEVWRRILTQLDELEHEDEYAARDPRNWPRGFSTPNRLP